MVEPTFAELVLGRLDEIDRRLTALEKIAHPQAVMTEERAEQVVSDAVQTVIRAMKEKHRTTPVMQFEHKRLCGDRRIC